MDKLLNKFCDIFLNLEDSYKSNKDKLNVSTKEDYLKKICYDKEGNLMFSRIKNMLVSESAGYKNESLNRYTQLIEILNSLEFYLNSVNELKIDNFNKMLYDAVSMKLDSSSNKLTQSYLDSLREPKDNIVTMSSKDMFKAYGEVASFSKKYRKKIVSIKLKEDFNNDFISITEETLKEIVALSTEDKFFKTDFQIRAASAFVYIHNNRKSRFDIDCIADKKLLDKNNNTILGRKISLTVEDNLLIAKYRGHNIYIV